jgi:phosphoribosyl-AMP cyclohydrolase / phosphoribosyl-ATP pyrophosphohydrolase
VIAARAETPTAGSYTSELLENRNRRLKKIGEEAAELVAACADGNASHATDEAADLLYHALVALRALGAGWDDVRAALARRRMNKSMDPRVG